jgi:hypothetical protein
MMLSPSKFFVACAKINERIDSARRAGDDAEIRRCTVELGSLYRAYYGEPLAS